MKLNLDSPVIDYINTLISYIVLNLLFLLCCLPIVTIGPAVAALYQVMMHEARKEYGYLYRRFLRYLKENFFPALGICIFFSLLLLIVSFSMVFWYSYSGMLSIIISLLLAALLIISFGAEIYAFPLLARFQNTVKQTVKNAFCMAVVHGKYTFFLILIDVVVVTLFYFFPVFRIFMLMVGFVFVAFCKCLLLSVIFAKYKSEKE